MYVVTFYSYKGGVGRTLALVNIAAMLAQTGRRVLAVDFDLEAPSLPDFDVFKGSLGQRGVVDYVTEYRDSGIAPDCHDFIVPCEAEGKPIWVMPAGCNADPGYTEKLNDIDWKKLYEEQDGYLFFEDLKQQWAEYDGDGFDYVLIDSRTGHTDVGGICTRHLPDAVSVMFLPNASNISGLIPIVKSIRDEKSNAGAKISLHVTPTNVPDLDDENDILSNLLSQAAIELNKGEEFSTTIHHYRSLDILETKPFSITRPNSKLAREFERLRLQIIGRNFEDREGALYTLSEVPDELNRARARNAAFEREPLLEQTRNILFLHPHDGEIAFLAARAFEALGDQTLELEALGIAIDQEFETERARLVRGVKSLSTAGDTNGAERDLKAVLFSPNATAFEIIPALNILNDFSQNWVSAVETALDRPNDQFDTILSVVMNLMAWKEAMPICAKRLLTLTEYEGLTVDARMRTHNFTSLCLIASGQFHSALEYIDRISAKDGKKRQVQHLFNRSMAKWGIDRSPPVNLLREFVDHPEIHAQKNSVNTRQCLALSRGALGDRDEALMQLHLARELLSPGITAFSCWSYLTSTSEELSEHFMEMEDAIQHGNAILPRFLASAED
jgi:MinD-like ATPase involved in chromosome partitioning or flagellar assembly